MEIPGVLGDGDDGRVISKVVTRTGLALVHENERVVPDTGSEAQSIVALEASGHEVHLHFPVEIEIRGSAQIDVTAEIEQALLGIARRLSGIA